MPLAGSLRGVRSRQASARTAVAITVAATASHPELPTALPAPRFYPSASAYCSSCSSFRSRATRTRRSVAGAAASSMRAAPTDAAISIRQRACKARATRCRRIRTSSANAITSPTAVGYPTTRGRGAATFRARVESSVAGEFCLNLKRNARGRRTPTPGHAAQIRINRT
jgi:hypothetical protein